MRAIKTIGAPAEQPDDASGRPRAFSIQVYVATLFVILVLVLGTLLSWLAYDRSRAVILLASDQLADQLAQTVSAEFRIGRKVAEGAVRMARDSDITFATNLVERLRGVNTLIEMADTRPEITATYIAYPNGDFFLLRPLRNDLERTIHSAPRESAYMIQSVERDGTDSVKSTFLFLDRQRHVIAQSNHPDYRFDPRTRIWFDTPSNGAVLVTPPYPFFSTREIGISLSMKTSARSVIGADLSLGNLSAVLDRLKPTPSSKIVLADIAGNLIATTGTRDRTSKSGSNPRRILMEVEDLDEPLITQAFNESQGRPDQSTNGTNTLADGSTWFYRVLREKNQGTPNVLIITLPETEMLATANRIRREAVLASIALLIIACPFVWLAARLVSRPLRRLAGEIRAIEGFDFDEPEPIRSRIVEINQLATGIDNVRDRIREFLILGRALGSAHDLEKILKIALKEISGVAGTSAAALFLLDESGEISSAVRIPEGRQEHKKNVRFPDLVDLVRRSSDAFQIETSTGSPLLGEAFNGQIPDGVPINAAVFPLLSAKSALLGIILLARTNGSAQIKIPEPVMGYASALAATAAMAIDSSQLYLGQKALLESFIQVLGNAIDAKSAYTGGHCQRVPELVEMIAQAAHDDTQGIMKDFRLSSEEREALYIGAWLHDCGKVTTPEFVMDKATKLETIYDRLHEIRMRFEVMKREAEVAAWRSIAAGADEKDELAKLTDIQTSLDEDFAFVASCNPGSEAMSPDAAKRLQKIAERTWTRTLDNMIGISAGELERKGKSPPATLPAREHALADLPEHIIERTEEHLFDVFNPWGITMKPPKHLYNFGEIHNLSIQRGTLTEEERYKINDHINQTIIMLSRMPFPSHLKDVPEIASTHHERIDGKGYPRGLTGRQMSPLAKMMAIADVFEALTAADRPYKSAKRLSQSLSIMDDMAGSGHLDPDIYRFFRESSIWRNYSHAHMNPDQIDM